MPENINLDLDKDVLDKINIALQKMNEALSKVRNKFKGAGRVLRRKVSQGDI
jgi:hypothetical protein